MSTDIVHFESNFQVSTRTAPLIERASYTADALFRECEPIFRTRAESAANAGFFPVGRIIKLGAEIEPQTVLLRAESAENAGVFQVDRIIKL